MPELPMKSVTIHTDGGCEGNPGPGGWAAVLRHGPRSREIAGGDPATASAADAPAGDAALEQLADGSLNRFSFRGTIIRAAVQIEPGLGGAAGREARDRGHQE